jgi:DNA-binding PadR family transcriptional regulator
MFWEFGYRHPGGGPRGWGRGRHGMGGPPGWWGDWFGGPPPRAERGGVRYLVLDAIAERPRHGYEIIQAIEERSKETYRPSPGVIYPTLQMLEELGHARIVEVEGRKSYEITDLGREDLAANREYVDEFYERFADSSWERYAADFGDVMKRVSSLMKTFRHAARRGHLTPPMLARVLKILDRAAVEIEELVEEGAGRGGRGR